MVCTVRSDARADALAAEGFEVWRGALDAERVAQRIDAETRVIVAFPPDGSTDAALAPHLTGARAIRYVSSTGVYHASHPLLDDHTAPSTSARAAPWLAAEAAYRAVGASVLRSPAIYGPDRGLHVRVVQGKHTLAGRGDNVLSRIHADDLATLLLAQPERHGQTYVVGDGGRESQREVVQWICEQYDVPFPASVPPDQVHPSLRVSRCIDPSRALRELGVTLRWPSFREGMAPAVCRIPAA